MMKSSKSLICSADSSDRGAPEGLAARSLGTFSKSQRALVGERRLQADRAGLLGFLEQPIEHVQVVVERLDLHALACGRRRRGRRRAA